MQIEKYAAIDIGSNAIRLLIANVISREAHAPLFRKNALVRVPIRLGEDVFLRGKISEKNQRRFLDAMNAFSLLMKAHAVVSYRACATSAMREAANGSAFAKAVFEKTGIQIDIIGGEEEAAIISATDLHEHIDSERVYLYVDVGGGSTEFTVYAGGTPVASKSFKIGTVRVLEDKVDQNTWVAAETWVQTNTQSYDQIDVLGTGGNINKIFKLSTRKRGAPLTYFYLSSLYKQLNAMTYEARIIDMELNPDRADVIIPALKIYLLAMKWSKSKNIYVPKVGLADGMIKSLYLASN